MKIIDISSYQPKPEDKFFLDTNVWVFLFCPIANNREHIVSKYSSFFSKVISSKSEVYTSSVVISEFINLYLRLDHALVKETLPRYKQDYRKSVEYKEAFALVKNIVEKKILSNAKQLDDNFKNMSFSTIITQAEKTDFNDALFSNMLKDTGISILTDDADFTHLSVNTDLFSGNPNLLR